MNNLLNKISILPADVANKIAAGEVVERPVAVIKELVENSIDAGARKIVVEVDAGGRQLMRVSDDGEGMSSDDAKLAVKRHATSKIKTARDIDAIMTLGFRGEALPSIAAVSRFELLTCHRETGKATKIDIDGGGDIRVSDAGRAPGTTVTVKKLFYCVPARAKFLKTTATELSHIGKFIHAVALAWPRVGFKYVVDGNIHFDLPPQKDDTDFLIALKIRIVQLRGNDLADDLIPINHSQENYIVTGFISSMSRSVLTGQELHFFVNSRPVKCSWLSSVVKRAYGTLLPVDRFPYVFLFLQIPPGSVDVNIHPAKREVRFGKEFAVQSAISSAIMESLQSDNAAPKVEFSEMSSNKLESVSEDKEKIKHTKTPKSPWSTKLTVEEWKKLYGVKTKEEILGADTQKIPSEINKSTVSESKTEISQTFSADMIKAAGQISDAYIIAQISGARNGIVLIDQHAAHERINFDSVVKTMETDETPRQGLLMPEIIHLSSEQSAIINERISELTKAGFDIESFGSDTFKIDAIPGFLNSGNLDSLFADLAN
ncbi:MAG: DNA mismatch repair endonuclease MutL, partial [Chlamydiae bacterium]